VEGEIMTMPIVYVDRSEIRPGAAAALRRAVARLVQFVHDREPQLVSYGFHIDTETSTMTVVAVHPDTASLELHLDIGGPEFRKVGRFITLRQIEVFGEPSEAAIQRLREKARLLGDAALTVRPVDAGFGRLAGSDPAARRSVGSSIRAGDARRAGLDSAS
jgi:hypothetical protein